MEFDILNIGLGLLAILSFVWSFFSEQYRVLAIVLGFVLFMLILISEQNQKIQGISYEQKRTEERLKIYEQLIDIRADIKALQNERNKR